MCLFVLLLAWLGLVILSVGCQPSPPRIPQELATARFDRFSPAGVAVNSKTGYVYFTSDYGRRVAVMKGTDIITILQTGGEGIPINLGLALDEVGNWLYVTNPYSDTVTVIQGTQVITQVETAGRDPQDITIEPRSQWAYVVSPYQKSPPSGQVDVVEGNVTVFSGTRIVGNILLEQVLATQILADPASGYVYVGGVGGDLVVIKGVQEIARFNVGSTVVAMDVNPRTGEVYVLNKAIDRNLTRFKAGKLVDTLLVVTGNVNTSSFGAVQVEPVTGNVYVTDSGKGEVVVVRNMKVIARIQAEPGILKMAADPLTGNVYVANYIEDTVMAIHGTQVITTYTVGWYPYGLGVNPANGWVYVSNTNDGSVTVLGYR